MAPRGGGESSLSPPSDALAGVASGGAASPQPCGFARYLREGSLGAGGYLQLIALRPGDAGDIRIIDISAPDDRPLPEQA